ncbi:TonB-dependent siderophore receptor [Acidovorax sp. SUPP950]|uniref:TonB-dependent siderophore receptor n=1 Tax=Acidovorax sp. SUPP950 TaxID=511901 RepID=UPI0023C122AB|nr:TonB-dependent siderophore receptor [Acidovorax sp. SUPP950]GKS77412.1 TonB-dependent siderophore receptor [Acidovorax sp. SUPP950]
MVVVIRNLVLSTALGVGWSAPWAHAQVVEPMRTNFHVPAASLEDALNAFARQAGITLSFDPTIVSGRKAAAVIGQRTVEEGLEALLLAHRLEATRTPGGAYVVRAMPVLAAGATLAPITVTANVDKEMATGPVHGYVAKRSATGTKTDSLLVETPQSVSVITSDELAARAVSSIKEAVGYTVGVTPSPAQDFREDLTTFRGFPFDWASFYLDGLAMPSTTYGVSTSEPYGMERIEVLRGPSSMLFGQSSTGGLLNMVSKRPTSDPIREIQFQIGSHQRRQIGIDLAGPVGESGEWTYRLTGLARRSDSDIDFVEDNRIFLAPALTWKPSAATSLTLLASTMADDLGHSGGTSAFLPASGIELPNPSGTIARNTNGGEPSFDYYKKKQHSVGYEFEHRFDGDWEFRQNARWRKVDVDYQTAYGLGLLTSDTSRRMLRRGAFGSFGNAESTAIDNQLQKEWTGMGAKHTTLVGLDYRSTKLDELRYFGFSSPGIDIFAPVYGTTFALPATPDTDQKTAARQLGLYLQNQAKFGQHWLLTLGARWDTAKHEIDDRLESRITTISEKKTTGRVGLTYLFDNGVAPYASIATSFTPTLDPNNYGAPFKARTGKQHEVGVKYQPPGSNSLYTVAVFDLKQRNVLTADPDQVNHPFGQVQTGAYRSRGLELEAKTELSKSLNVMAAYTYIDAKVAESNNGNVGNTPKGIPRHTASAWADYKVRGGSLNGLGFGVGARYVGKRPSADAPGFYMVPAFTILDAAMSYELDSWRLALNVGNLTNKVTYDCWLTRCWYGPGRSLKATATLRW